MRQAQRRAIRSFLATTLWLTTWLSDGPAAVWVQTPEYRQQSSDALFKNRDGVGNVLARLRAGGKVKVGYMGGSVTQAAGWRVKSLEWFRQEFPQAQVDEVYACLGGTNSSMGVFRMDREILPYNPDLMFIEFARNSDTMTPHDVWVSMEGIVRKLWKLNPRMDIVFVYTYARGYGQPDWDAGRMPLYDSAMEQLAAHYGIPSLNFAQGMARLERQGRVLCAPQAFGLIAKRDRDLRDWWLGWRTSCDWQTEARDHWLTFGFDGDANDVFAGEPRQQLRAGAWQHLAVTRQDQQVTLYVDGAAVARQTAAASPGKPSKAPVLLGTIGHPFDTHNQEAHAFQGWMDDAAIFCGALDAAAVAALHRGETSPRDAAAQTPAAPLAAYWDFEQTSGTSVPDLSGHERHGVLKNAAQSSEPRAAESCWTSDTPANLKNSRGALRLSGGHMKSEQAQYVEVPGLTDLDLSGDFTLCLWVKPETLGIEEIMFSVDGIHPLQSGHRLYADFVSEAFRAMGGSRPVDHGPKLARPFVADNWEDARQVPLEPKYLAGPWQTLDENDPIARPWKHHAGTLWASQNPGSVIRFRFRGAGFGLMDITAPDAGQLIVTIDGVRQEKTVSRFLPWSRSHGLAHVLIADGLDRSKVHDVTLEIHPEEPNRRGIWGPFPESSMEQEIAKPQYRGKWIRASHLLIRGEILTP